MKRPRVSMVLNAPGLGGVTEVVHQLLRHLPAGRFELSLYMLKSGDENDPARRSRTAGLQDLGVEVATAQEKGKVDVIAELATWLIDRRIDIVHTHSYRPNIYGRMAAALCRPNGLKVIAHYHNHYADKWLPESSALLLERRLAAGTDGFIAVSRQVRQHVADLVNIHAERIDVVENGVDFTRLSDCAHEVPHRDTDAAKGALTVGLVGRICEQKGQSDLVDAAAELAATHPDTRYVFFGDAEDKALHAELRQRIADAGLDHAFEFAGHVSDISSIYTSVDIIAAPSRWEGFPLAIGEAMAAGKPIVASAVSAIPEMLGNGACGLLVPPNDPARLASGLGQLITCPDLRRRLGDRARSRSARFSWQRAACAVATVYDRIHAHADERSSRCD